MKLLNVTIETFFFYALASLSILCQMAGYASAGRWGWIIAGICLAVMWSLSRKYETQTIGSLTLIVTVGLAVTGIALGYSGWLMIVSAAFGLAAWDALLLGAKSKEPWDDSDWQPYRDNHLKTCLMGVICGMVLALLGRQINLQIPFVVMMGLVILAVLLLGRVWRYFIYIEKEPPEE